MKSELLGMDQKYSDNSLAQYQCHEFAKHHLKNAALKINLNKELIKIGVYGCGPGDNDLLALQQHFIPHVNNKNAKFEIYMIDIAKNKWSQLDHHYQDIKVFGITSDIYKKILPEGSLDLVISFSCLHWFRKIPFDISNEFSWSCLNTDKKNILRNYLDQSLIEFLEARRFEMSENAQMILSFDGEFSQENHQYQGPTDCLVKIIKKIKLQKELQNFFIPTGPRTINNVRKCFKKVDLKLNEICLKYIECPIWDKYKFNLDQEILRYRFAEEINKSIISCVLPILKNHISEDFIEWLEHEMIEFLVDQPLEKWSTAGNVILLTCHT